MKLALAATALASLSAITLGVARTAPEAPDWVPVTTYGSEEGFGMYADYFAWEPTSPKDGRPGAPGGSVKGFWAGLGEDPASQVEGMLIVNMAPSARPDGSLLFAVGIGASGVDSGDVALEFERRGGEPVLLTDSWGGGPLQCFTLPTGIAVAELREVRVLVNSTAEWAGAD
ncbi:MAG: hypothetical protein AAFZ65_19040 [Planctomycetota bacterium]